MYHNLDYQGADIMSIFGSKKEKQKINERRLQILESENAQLNEKCSRYQVALNQAHKENEDYKRKYNELLGRVSGASGFSDDEFVRLKEECRDYKVKLDNANREIENYKQAALNYQSQIKELKDRYRDVVNHMLISSSDETNDVNSVNSQNNNPIYSIMDEVRKNPDYMSALYCSKNSFLSQNEIKMYYLLENFAYDNCTVFGSLSIFANTRLADFTKLFESNYIDKEDSFCKKTNKNPNKKAVCKIIDKLMPHFNNDDYKLAFLYPLLRMHVDFLICVDDGDNTTKPILAIELHGTEHDRNSMNPDWSTIYNDEFKKSLFEYKNNAMGVRLLVIKNEELENEDKLIGKIYDSVEKCLQSPPEPVGNKKWNNRVYGNEGEYYIFVDDLRLNITNETAEKLNYYVKDMSDFFQS